MGVQRWRYFCHVENVIDFGLVLVSCVDAYVLGLVVKDDAGINLNFLRLIRLVRLLRTLRVLRTLRLFRHLRVLVKTVTASFIALVWSMVLPFILMFLAAIFMCQTLKDGYLLDPNVPHETRMWVWKKYGTSVRAFYTMFEVTFSGG